MQHPKRNVSVMQGWEVLSVIQQILADKRESWKNFQQQFGSFQARDIMQTGLDALESIEVELKRRIEDDTHR